MALTKLELIYKIEQDTYYLRKMFESCTTEEQIKSVLRLVDFLICVKWYNLEKQLSLYESMIVWEIMLSAGHDLDIFYKEALDRINGCEN